MSRNHELAHGYHTSRTYQADLEPVTAEVAAQYHNTHGGSSFYVHGGDRAVEGYVVGGLEGAPETHVDGEHITADEFQAHRDRVRSQVSDSNAVAGSWAEDGRSVLDASNVVQTAEEAKRLQVARDERAVYNLSAGREENLR